MLADTVLTHSHERGQQQGGLAAGHAAGHWRLTLSRRGAATVHQGRRGQQ